jgi:hypothetical protein
VSLFSQLASQLLPQDGASDAVANIPVRTPDGTSTEVQLGVKRGTKAIMPKASSLDDQVGATKDYLEHHQLQQKIQSIIQDVLHHQPEDPYSHMLQLLQASKKQQPAPQASAPMVPRAPDAPKPEGSAPRKGPLNSGNNAAGTSGGKQEAKMQLARWTVRQVLRMPACVKVSEESFRAASRKELTASLVTSILRSARDKSCATVAAGQSVSTQARASVTMLLGYSAVYLSPEYRLACCRWAVRLSYRGAANIIGAREDYRVACFASDDSRRRVSLPTPIVFLGGDQSWGQWLSRGPM